MSALYECPRVQYNAPMPLPRPRFRLSTLLWVTLAVACWFGGANWGWRRNERNEQWTTYRVAVADSNLVVEFLIEPDGTRWSRRVSENERPRVPVPRTGLMLDSLP
jgi:hypothetical protein